MTAAEFQVYSFALHVFIATPLIIHINVAKWCYLKGKIHIDVNVIEYSCELEV